MVSPAQEGIYEAIFFLNDQFVSRQIHYAEFESMLENGVIFKGYLDTEITAVYAEIAANLAPTALVFFKLYVDENGVADTGWSVPLRRLARISGSGPDLGAGPVKLACRSQCAISWNQKDLWDPDMAPGSNDFKIIRLELAENKLGFGKANDRTNWVDMMEAMDGKTGMDGVDGMESDDDIPVLTSAVGSSAPSSAVFDETAFMEEQEKQHRAKLARLLKAQRLRIKTLNSQHEAELEEVVRQNRIEIQGYKTKLRELEQSAQHHKVLNEKIKSTLQKRNSQFLQLQEQEDKQCKKIAELQQELLRALPSQEFDNQKQRWEGEVNILQEQLARRATELKYRDDKEAQLKAQIDQLNERLQCAEDEDIVKRMAELDIVFVVYHTGAGHITLSLKDVRRYMESPTAFVAERCGVSEDDFKLWLKHHEKPVCDICKTHLTRVSQPTEFAAGKSNRCEAHSID